MLLKSAIDIPKGSMKCWQTMCVILTCTTVATLKRRIQVGKNPAGKQESALKHTWDSTEEVSMESQHASRPKRTSSILLDGMPGKKHVFDNDAHFSSYRNLIRCVFHEWQCDIWGYLWITEEVNTFYGHTLHLLRCCKGKKFRNI